MQIFSLFDIKVLLFYIKE